MNPSRSNLARLLEAVEIGSWHGNAAAAMLNTLAIVPALLRPAGDVVSRAELAQALNMVLFHDLVLRVPVSQDYVADVLATGQRVVFDHGALRTVHWASGALPPGEAALTRVLRPLGYELGGIYPLTRLRMTGRAWRHADLPEDIAQFFVSELHPEQFSPAFQAAVTRVLASSHDPLVPQDIADLEQLGRDQSLPFTQAVRLLPKLAGCFARQHGLFDLADYEILLAESSEMAWIATEGNVFNHATDRVANIEAVAEQQRALGRPIKESIEISAAGSVRQTAFRATTVERRFLVDNGVVARNVPGSFYEFITRDPIADGSASVQHIDLRFDAGNATGIFRMTDAARAA